MIVIIPVVLLHLCYRNRTQLATRILTALCVSIFLFEVRKLYANLARLLGLNLENLAGNHDHCVVAADV